MASVQWPAEYELGQCMLYVGSLDQSTLSRKPTQQYKTLVRLVELDGAAVQCDGEQALVPPTAPPPAAALYD